MKLGPLVLLGLLVFAGFAPTESRALVIDDFSAPQSLSLPLGTLVVGQNATGSMLGGVRRVTLHDTALSTTATGVVASGLLEYTPSARTPTNFSFVTWSAVGGVDLTEGGWNDRFRIELGSALSAAPVWVTVADLSGVNGRWLVETPGPMPLTVDFRFRDISSVFGDAVDLTRIININIRLVGPTTIDSFAAVPEPGVPLLGVSGGLLLMLLARRAGRSRSASRS